MISVLEKFNFGEGFIKWVKILYNMPVIAVKNNGWISADISLSRGVRQGCPLSALLFVLAVEVMAIQIRNNDDINGFKCQDQHIKNSMYADDTTLLLSSLNSLEHAIDTVENFSRVAGPKLNVEKTDGILLGPLKNTTNEHYGIKFTNDAVKCLGIYMGHNKADNHQKNWQNKIDKIKMVFERWKHRNLTFFGKILIIKSLAISKLIHTMSILITPEDVLKGVEKMIFNFLWDSNERIKRKTLIGTKIDGGIQMLDIYCKDKSLKARWIKRISEKNVNSNFINEYLNKYGLDIEYLVKCTITDVNLLSKSLKIPLFWAQVFAYANQCKSIVNDNLLSDSNFLSEPIWLNERFKINKKPVFISNWSKSNIRYVKDLFDQQGNFITERNLLETLRHKTNWMTEYIKMKGIFNRLKNKFDTKNAKYINIKNRWTLLHNNAHYNLKTQKSRFYYDILINKKFVRNYMEHAWSRDFDMEADWGQIYMNQVWKLTDKKLAEFNYKLLCNIICTRSLISKWNKNIHANCTHCGKKQSVKHLLFECDRCENIWALIGSILNVEIRYKHIVVGNRIESDYIRCRNLVISYITYAIFKFWIMSENGKINFNEPLHEFIKRDLFKRTLYIKEHTFITICDKILKNM